MFGVAVYAGLILLLYALYLVLATIHEAGHYAAGVICRFAPQKVRVGPIEIHRTLDTKWSWTFKFRWGSLLSGETRIIARPSAISRIQLRYLFFILGGPLANLLIAAAAIAWARHETALGAFCKFFIIGSVLIAFGNLLPFRGPNGRSDGGRVVDIVFFPKRRDDLLFKICLAARFLEIRELSQMHLHQKALDLLDGQMRLAESLQQNGNYRELCDAMTRLRPILEKAIKTCDHNAETVIVLDSCSDLVAGT